MNRRFVWLDRWKTNQFPRFEWVDHRAQEPELGQVQEQMKRSQIIVKRNVSDSQRAEARRGKAKTWKNWQRRQKNNILMPMLRCLPTRHWRVEDVAGDVADAAPEQMNSFAQSKTEAFEKIEESLRPLRMVEDPNGDKQDHGVVHTLERV